MLTRAVSCHREACFDVCGVHHGRSADGYILEVYGYRLHSRSGISDATPGSCGTCTQSTTELSRTSFRVLVDQSARDVGIYVGQDLYQEAWTSE